MKNLFHVRPPLALPTGFEGLLHRHHHGPPFLSLWIGRHFRHVGGIVGAVIFKVSEQEVVFSINGISSKVPPPNHGEYFRPHPRVVFLVGFNRLRPYSDYRTVALHVIVLSRSFCGFEGSTRLTMRVTRCTLHTAPLYS